MRRSNAIINKFLNGENAQFLFSFLEASAIS